MPYSKPTNNSTSLDIYDQSKHSSCDNCGRTNRLTTLYAFPGNEPVQIRYFKIPGKYHRLCSSCFEDANEHTPGNLTEDELIAGIISDSYGYATPSHAARHINDFKEGKQHCHCERGHAHFDNDLDALMEAARRRWVSRSPEEKTALLETVAEWRDIEEQDTAAAFGVSMAYPSQNPESSTDQDSTDTHFSSLSTQKLEDTLFIRTDTYRVFTLDTLPDNPDEVILEYVDKNHLSYLSREDAESLFQNHVQRVDISTLDTTPPMYSSTFLSPTTADIDALQATLSRSNHPPAEYLDYFLSLKLVAGHFDMFRKN